MAHATHEATANLRHIKAPGDPLHHTMTRHRQPASGVTFARNPVGTSSNKPKTATPGSVTKVYVAYFKDVMVRSGQQTQAPEASSPDHVFGEKHAGRQSSASTSQRKPLQLMLHQYH
jgi:hypothetical protein